jgi:polyphenol oxidase
MSTQITSLHQPPAPASPAFVWEPAPWGHVLTCPPLAAAGTGRHGFTTRELDLGRGATADSGWTAVAGWLGVPHTSLWRLDQVHGCTAVRVDAATMPAGALASADAAITTCADAALAVKAADCVPILLAHPGGAIAAVHAGWRGTAQRIAGKTVADLAAVAGGSPRDLVAAIGPSIGPCCYEVGPEVRETFHVAGFVETDLDRWFLPAESPRATHVLDMWRANRDQLVAAGLDPANVHVAGLCTATHSDWFWSYRREGPNAGRLLGVIRRAS